MPPSNAATELDRYLRLANLKLPEADALEEPPEPPSIIEAIKRDRSVDEQKLTKYDELVRVAEHMRNSALNHAKRKQFAKDLVGEMTAALSKTPQGVFSHYCIDPTDAGGAAVELYELRHFVRGVFLKITSNLSRGRAAGSAGAWRVEVSHLYDIDSNGRISANLGAWGPFEKVLERIDAWRVRQCCVCRKNFYARRTNQKACSKGCGRNERARRWRRKEKEREQRRKLKQQGVRREDT